MTGFEQLAVAAIILAFLAVVLAAIAEGTVLAMLRVPRRPDIRCQSTSITGQCIRGAGHTGVHDTGLSRWSGR